MKFRTGEKLKRTIYLQLGDAPDHRPPAEGGDLVIGMVDPGWGELVVALLNEAASEQVGVIHYRTPGPEAMAAMAEAHLRRRRADGIPEW